VRALTGVDTDRLAEEKRRGISIELGFAELVLPSGASIGIVDVPGHERLVRTMVAGAGGIDMFLLVVAADDGVMPQTIEHLEALRALGVEHGIVALSKVDLVDADTLELARAEAARLVPGAPVVPVSAAEGDGVERLRTTIGELAQAVAAARGATPGGPPAPGILHVDRSFTIAGAGTVVTGTVAGDGFAAGARVRILPVGLDARVRAIEVHGRPARSVGGGRRAALNLAGIDRRRVPRGSVVSAGEPGPRAAYRIDVRLLGAVATDPSASGRVQVHHGTRDVAARLVPLGDGLAQLRLEAPLVARARDRVVLRSISPASTLGGAEVVDPSPPRHGAGSGGGWPRLMAAGSADEIVAAAIGSGAALAADPGEWDADSPLAFALPRFSAGEWQAAIAALTEAGRLRTVRGALAPAQAAGPAAPVADPLDRIDVRLLALLAADGPEPRPPQALADALAITGADARARLDRLAAADHVRRLGADVYYDPPSLERLEALALELARERGSITLAGLRDALGSSRKYAQAIVEHLDRSGLTVRRGDEHLPRPSAATARP
jgi:selenocysteine-specific elongation factor